jgi:hypothetical protein
MNEFGIIIILTVILIVILGVNLFPKLLILKCPNCGKRTFELSGGCKYSCKDIWGHNGVSYTIYSCEECKVAKVNHRKGWDEINYDDKEDQAHIIVFGKTIDESKKQITSG